MTQLKLTKNEDSYIRAYAFITSKVEKDSIIINIYEIETLLEK